MGAGIKREADAIPFAEPLSDWYLSVKDNNSVLPLGCSQTLGCCPPQVLTRNRLFHAAAGFVFQPTSLNRSGMPFQQNQLTEFYYQLLQRRYSNLNAMVLPLRGIQIFPNRLQSPLFCLPI